MVSEGTAAKLDSLKRTIQRQRERVLAVPIQPTTLEELNLPPEYQQTAKEEQFLLYDSGPEPQRILIFGTQRNLDMLQASQCWLADETELYYYLICPKLKWCATPRKNSMVGRHN